MEVPVCRSRTRRTKSSWPKCAADGASVAMQRTVLASIPVDFELEVFIDRARGYAWAMVTDGSTSVATPTLNLALGFDDDLTVFSGFGLQQIGQTGALSVELDELRVHALLSSEPGPSLSWTGTVGLMLALAAVARASLRRRRLSR